ncbi:SDR family NAD(P)-dependent oxidoreductase [Bacteroidota bacterium]
MNLKDKVVLITGGSRGIGKETSLLFAQKGASVIINYRSNTKEAKNTLALLKPGKHKIYQADVSDVDDVKKMIGDIIAEYSRIDVLVNNAAIAIEHDINKIDFEEWLDAWDKTININLTGLANICFLAAKQMIIQNSGHIINVSSRGAFRGEPKYPAYGASKSGVNALSQSLAKALGEHNISVTVVAPGFVETDMGKQILDTEEGEALRNESPFKRVAYPDEVAHIIAFLAEEKSTFMSGGIIDINGASFLRM